MGAVTVILKIRGIPVYDGEKIILMSRVAVYEKNEGADDKKKMTYFMNDYVYRKNSRMRFGVIIGCLLLVMLYVFYLFAVVQVDFITGIDYWEELRNIAVFVIAVVVGYSVLGTAIYMVDYKKSEKRLAEYKQCLLMLDPDYKEPKPKELRQKEL